MTARHRHVAACDAAAEREYAEREQARRDAADQAMRRQNLAVSMFCTNLAAGRDGFAGIGQFVEGSE